MHLPSQWGRYTLDSILQTKKLKIRFAKELFSPWIPHSLFVVWNEFAFSQYLNLACGWVSKYFKVTVIQSFGLHVLVGLNDTDFLSFLISHTQIKTQFQDWLIPWHNSVVKNPGVSQFSTLPSSGSQITTASGWKMVAPAPGIASSLPHMQRQKVAHPFAHPFFSFLIGY